MDDEAASATVGTEGAARLEHMEQIADGADAGRVDEFEDVPEAVEDADEIDRAYLAELDARIEAEEAERAALRTFKVKVDGKEVELSEAEAREKLQKNLAADQRLAQASQMRREAEAEKAEAEAKVKEAVAMLERAKQAPQPQESEDERIARELQSLPPAELANRLRQMQANLVPQIQAKVAADMEAKAAALWAKDAFPDIWRDPIATEAFLGRDAKLVAAKDPRSYQERYTALAEEIRAWRGSTQSMSDRAQRKRESLTSLPTASVRLQAVPEESAEEESTAAIISRMARARGQQINGIR